MRSFHEYEVCVKSRTNYLYFHKFISEKYIFIYYLLKINLNAQYDKIRRRAIY